jgi:hypothetical protein
MTEYELLIEQLTVIRQHQDLQKQRLAKIVESLDRTLARLDEWDQRGQSES